MVSFIGDLVIPDLQKMVDQQLHYYAFAVICQGIEIMGAAFDSHALEDNGLSELRFKNGLKNFFGDHYRQNQSKFFSVLRGPLIHQLRPGEGFLLASIKKDGVRADAHLTQQGDGVTLLLIEVFLEHFVRAFTAFRNRMAKNTLLTPERFNDVFLVVAPLDAALGKAEWSKSRNELITLTPYATGSYIAFDKFPDSAADSAR
jgi:hypothetical protein